MFLLSAQHDPDVKKVMDVLFKADDVKVHRKFFVSCQNKGAAKRFQSELRDYDPNRKKFHVLPYNPSFNSKTQENKCHIKFFVSCQNKGAAKRFQSELRDYDPNRKKFHVLPYNPSFNSKTQENKCHIKFFVSCQNKAASKRFQSELRDYDPNRKKFHVLPYDPSFNSKTQENKRHMLYVVSLPRNTTDKDLQNSFTKAKSVHITTFPKGKKLVRMGHICFDNSIDAKDALAIKNRRINGKYIQVTARKSAAMKRPFAQNVSSLPSKKAKLFMDKKTEDDADDHDNMLSNDQEDCGEDGESHDSDVNEKKEEDDESQNYEDGNRNDEEVDLDNET
ncbi:uncharacterized protein [Panulirus ornatus]|uniref:uncharacterized protein isoform X3 n=1 Tax=Panulirus ornatus TaxID=150431 RepID=UPI003A83E28C